MEVYRILCLSVAAGPKIPLILNTHSGEGLHWIKALVLPAYLEYLGHPGVEVSVSLIGG